MNSDTFVPRCKPTKNDPKLDHTFILTGGNEVFRCWGSATKDKSKSVELRKSGTIPNAYNTANCYRFNVDLFGKLRKDTAGIGVYGVNGVCHQSTNCFLLSVGGILEINHFGRPHGLLISVAAYGIYGTLIIWWPSEPDNPVKPNQDSIYDYWWYQQVFTPCAEENHWNIASPSNTLFDSIHTFYKKVEHTVVKNDPHYLRVNELRIFMKHHIPDHDELAYHELHREKLNAIEKVISDLKPGYPINESSAKRINEASHNFQYKLAKKIGTENYKKVTGLEAGEVINILDKDILGF